MKTGPAGATGGAQTAVRTFSFLRRCLGAAAGAAAAAAEGGPAAAVLAGSPLVGYVDSTEGSPQMMRPVGSSKIAAQGACEQSGSCQTSRKDGNFQPALSAELVEIVCPHASNFIF